MTKGIIVFSVFNASFYELIHSLGWNNYINSLQKAKNTDTLQWHHVSEVLCLLRKCWKSHHHPLSVIFFIYH